MTQMHRWGSAAILASALGCGDSGELGSGGATGATSGSTVTTTTSPAATGPGATSSASTTGQGGAGGSSSFSLSDPLRGSTLGLQDGGTLGPDGWTVTGNADRIIYELPRLVEGSAEFTMTNVTMANLPLNDHEVFAMYEGGYGMVEPIPYNPEFRDNHYKCMIRIYGQAEVGREGQQKLMWGLCPSGDPGYGICGCASFFEEPFGGDGTWDGTPQRLRVEWGGGVTRYLRNDVEVLTIDWSASGLGFGPSELHLSLGTSRPLDVGAASMPIGAVFSDVSIQGTIGEEETCP